MVSNLTRLMFCLFLADPISQLPGLSSRLLDWSYSRPLEQILGSKLDRACLSPSICIKSRCLGGCSRLAMLARSAIDLLNLSAEDKSFIMDVVQLRVLGITKLDTSCPWME